MATLNQHFATNAYQQVTEFKESHKEDKKAQSKYGTMAHKLPILVRTSGLVQAVAFVQTRGNEYQKLLLAHLAETLGYDGVGTFADDTRRDNLQDYMLLTRRVLAALLWYKRFAESVLDVLPGDEDEAEDA